MGCFRGGEKGLLCRKYLHENSPDMCLDNGEVSVWEKGCFPPRLMLLLFAGNYYHRLSHLPGQTQTLLLSYFSQFAAQSFLLIFSLPVINSTPHLTLLKMEYNKSAVQSLRKTIPYTLCFNVLLLQDLLLYSDDIKILPPTLGPCCMESHSTQYPLKTNSSRCMYP
jgi:hypothetical protein